MTWPVKAGAPLARSRDGGGLEVPLEGASPMIGGGELR